MVCRRCATGLAARRFGCENQEVGSCERTGFVVHCLKEKAGPDFGRDSLLLSVGPENILIANL